MRGLDLALGFRTVGARDLGLRVSGCELILLRLPQGRTHHTPLFLLFAALCLSYSDSYTLNPKTLDLEPTEDKHAEHLCYYHRPLAMPLPKEYVEGQGDLLK